MTILHRLARQIRTVVAASSLIALVTGTTSLAVEHPDAQYSFRQGYHARFGGGLDSVAISPDGTLVASGGDDIRVVNVKTGQIVARPIDRTGYIVAMEFSPDGRWLVTGSYDEDGGPASTIIWDAHHWKRAATLTTHQGIGSIAFSPDGRYLAVATASDYGVNTVRVWSMPSRRLVIRRKGYAQRVTFSPDGKLLAMREKRGVRVMGTTTWLKRCWILLQSDSENLVGFTGHDIVIRSGSRLSIVDAASSYRTTKLRMPAGAQTYSPLAGQPVVLVGGYYKSANEAHKLGWRDGPFVSMWDCRTGHCVGYSHANCVPTYCALSDDKVHFVTGSSNAVDPSNTTFDIATWTIYPAASPPRSVGPYRSISP